MNQARLHQRLFNHKVNYACSYCHGSPCEATRFEQFFAFRNLNSWQYECDRDYDHTTMRKEKIWTHKHKQVMTGLEWTPGKSQKKATWSPQEIQSDELMFVTKDMKGIWWEQGTSRRGTSNLMHFQVKQKFKIPISVWIIFHVYRPFCSIGKICIHLATKKLSSAKY